MKRTLHSLAALVVAAAAVPLAPVGAQNMVFFLGGGQAFGMQDLNDGTDTGWIGFAGADFLIKSVPGLSVGPTASYTHIPYSGVDAATNIPALFGELGYLVGATSPSPFKPYIRGGVGVMSHRFDVGGGYNGSSTSETKVGVSGGAGINWIMPSVSPFIGAHVISAGKSTSFFTVYIGLAFGGGGGSAPSTHRKF